MSSSITKSPGIIGVFPSHVRALVHPGITTSLKTREELHKLNELGLAEFPSLLLQGMSGEEAGESIYKKYFLSRFSYNDPEPRSYPQQSDQMAYDEACDYVEKHVLHKPLVKLTVQEVHTLFHEIHKRIIDPFHPHLAKQSASAGQYRPPTSDMVICKDVDVSYEDLIPMMSQRLEAARGTPKEREMKEKCLAARELKRLFMQKRCTMYELLEDGTVPSAVKALCNEFFVACPPPKSIKPKMDSFIQAFQKKLASKEDPVKVAAFAHSKFVEIHPYLDANGRMARMLMNIILMQEGHQPIAFAFDDSYTNALRAEESGKASFEQFIRPLVAQFDYEAFPISVLAALNSKAPKTDLTAGIALD